MSSPFLLQVLGENLAPSYHTAIGSFEQPATLSVWELTLKGGWIMALLAFLSLVAIYLFVVKLLEFRKASREERSFLDRIKDYVNTNRIDAAIALCESTNTPTSHILAKLLARKNRSMQEMMAIVENAGSVEAGRLQKSMPLLATIAAGAPMLGFLGTVTGMVRAFFDMANSSKAVDISVLSSGIYEALVTTIGGLIVGIATLFIYNFLVARLNGVLNKVEAMALDMVDFLQDHK